MTYSRRLSLFAHKFLECPFYACHVFLPDCTRLDRFHIPGCRLHGQSVVSDSPKYRLSQRFDITDIREGEGGPAHLWYAYQAKRVAAAEGVADDDELRKRVRREFPPPPYLDFRLG